jgi:MarR family transcriptional regulator, lower aerobic nicotinate degradation pathway regulator
VGEPGSAQDETAQQAVRVVTTVGEHYYASAEGLGLTVQEARLLFILALRPSNMLGLTSALQVPKSTMTGLMSRMESAGLVARAPDADDRRSLVVTPTRRGRRVAESFAREMADRVDDVIATLDQGEQEELRDLLTEVLTAAEPDAGHQPPV